MTKSLVDNPDVQALLDRVAGVDSTAGNPRVKAVVRRVAQDIFRAIEDLDVQPDEFWAGVAYITRLGQANEAGLLVPGLGIETFLDLRLDEAEKAAGIEGGTPRTIEGPLYIAGAPLAKAEARLDDGSETGEVLIMEGQVRDVNGKPVAGAVVDVWHANTKGGYSFFDPSPGEVQPAPPDRDRWRGPLQVPLDPALGLRLPAGRRHPGAARPARPPRQPSGAHPLLRLGGRLPPPDDADQHRWRRIPARRFCLRDPRRADPAGREGERRRSHSGERAERPLHRDHVRLRAARRGRRGPGDRGAPRARPCRLSAHRPPSAATAAADTPPARK